MTTPLEKKQTFSKCANVGFVNLEKNRLVLEFSRFSAHIFTNNVSFEQINECNGKMSGSKSKKNGICYISAQLTNVAENKNSLRARFLSHFFSCVVLRPAILRVFAI